MEAAPTRASSSARNLRERVEHPRVVGDKLRDAEDRYKIKLRSAGYRLVYEVEDDRLVIVVVAGQRRDRSEIYLLAKTR